MKRKKWLLLTAAAFLAAGLMIAMEWMDMPLFIKKDTKKFQMTDKVVRNPLIGFAPDARFSEEVMDYTLVYVDITFRELWPEKDKMDFESIERTNKLERWRKEGKHMVLRFITDYPQPQEHMDIPDWLFEETGRDGDFYDHGYGKGYSPNYENPLFIEYHKKAVEALGEHFGEDTFLSYVELGSLGHWGEWHTNFERGVRQLPQEEIRRQYVLPYVSAFPHAKLLMRRPFRIAQEFNMGIYNDMAGHPVFTREWLSWIEKGGDYDQTFEKDSLVPMREAWQTAPIGGEFNSDLPMMNMMVANLEQTVQMIRDSHTSFLGPKVPYSEDKHSSRFYDGADQILNAMGYRIGVTEVVWLENFASTAQKIKLKWENSGSAPLYWDWPVSLYFYNAYHELLFKVPVEVQLSQLLPGKSIQTKTTIPSYPELEEAVFLYLGIEDPMTGEPAVQLVSDQEALHHLFLIYEWQQ